MRGAWARRHPHPGWEAILSRWRVTAAIVATGTPIAPAVRASSNCQVDYGDEADAADAPAHPERR